jgi:hypothetical protein
MFQRILVDDWAFCLPILSFFIFAALFVLVACRALRLGKSERSRLASLPLDEKPDNLEPLEMP